MQLLDKSSSNFLYQQVIDYVEKQEKKGVFRAGDKLPSLRKLSKQLDISVPTVKQAYIELERQGAIYARPQSGYYLKAKQVRTLLPMRDRWLHSSPAELQCRSLIEQVYAAIHLPNTVALGLSNPVNTHPPDKALSRLMKGVLSRVSEKSVSYGPVNGDSKLRLSIALRYQEQGVAVNYDDIIITNGAQEALSIALQCVASKGDVIAVESPCYFGQLELIESLGMKVVEVYTCTENGVCSTELEKVLKKHKVKACLFTTTVNNPLGSMMTNAERKDLVELVEKYNIPLIEDEVYSELYFTEEKPKPAELYSKKGLVLTCSSFSKTAAPGYRIGWLLAGQYEEKAKGIKRSQSCATSMLPQWTLTDYLMSGEYDKHLQILRRKLQYNSERMRALITDKFPKEVCISEPKGGGVLWVRCRSHVDTEKLFHEAIENGVSFAPGAIFSASRKYNNFMRISFGVQWSDEVVKAITTLGGIVKKYSQK
ncbi:PLP-dependent aminotransferase family protein [Colwellia sp. RE-S-Sl-9]